MRGRGVIAMIVLALLAALALVYRGEGGPALGRPRVIAIFKASGEANAFWAAVRDGVESGAKDFALELSLRAPRDEIYVDEQIQILGAP